MSRFGQAILEYRTQVGMTQQELADKASISRSYIAEIETGTKNHPSQEFASHLIDFIDLPNEKKISLSDAWAEDQMELPLDVQRKIAETYPIRLAIRSACALGKGNDFWEEQLKVAHRSPLANI